MNRTCQYLMRIMWIKSIKNWDNIKHKSIKDNLTTLYMVLLQSSFVSSVPHVAVYNSF